MHDVIVIGGGQSGLAAARAAQNQGLTPMILEAGPEPVGSWPHYYDSLTLFSPAEYSGISGAPFPGEADRYPERDEVAEYLRLYPAALGVDIRTETRVRGAAAGMAREDRHGHARAGHGGVPQRPRHRAHESATDVRGLRMPALAAHLTGAGALVGGWRERD